jgi:hypothetical protein
MKTIHLRTCLSILICFFVWPFSFAAHAGEETKRPLKPAPGFTVPGTDAVPLPTPEPSPAPKYTHFFIGLNLTAMKIEFSTDDSEFDLGFTVGYLLSPHHQFNVSYLGQSFKASQLTLNSYRAAYRYNLGSTPSSSFFVQVSGGWIHVKVAATSVSRSVFGFDFGKNFQIFEDSHIVFAPTVGLEKVASTSATIKIVPISFGFYF